LDYKMILNSEIGDYNLLNIHKSIINQENLDTKCTPEMPKELQPKEDKGKYYYEYIWSLIFNNAESSRHEEWNFLSRMYLEALINGHLDITEIVCDWFFVQEETTGEKISKDGLYQKIKNNIKLTYSEGVYGNDNAHRSGFIYVPRRKGAVNQMDESMYMLNTEPSILTLNIETIIRPLETFNRSLKSKVKEMVEEFKKSFITQEKIVMNTVEIFHSIFSKIDNTVTELNKLLGEEFKLDFNEIDESIENIIVDWKLVKKDIESKKDKKNTDLKKLTDAFSKKSFAEFEGKKFNNKLNTYKTYIKGIVNTFSFNEFDGELNLIEFQNPKVNKHTYRKFFEEEEMIKIKNIILDKSKVNSDNVEPPKYSEEELKLKLDWKYENSIREFQEKLKKDFEKIKKIKYINAEKIASENKNGVGRVEVDVTVKLDKNPIYDNDKISWDSHEKIIPLLRDYYQNNIKEINDHYSLLKGKFELSIENEVVKEEMEKISVNSSEIGKIERNVSSVNYKKYAINYFDKNSRELETFINDKTTEFQSELEKFDSKNGKKIIKKLKTFKNSLVFYIKNKIIQSVELNWDKQGENNEVETMTAICAKIKADQDNLLPLLSDEEAEKFKKKMPNDMSSLKLIYNKEFPNIPVANHGAITTFILNIDDPDLKLENLEIDNAIKSLNVHDKIKRPNIRKKDFVKDEDNKEYNFQDAYERILYLTLYTRYIKELYYLKDKKADIKNGKFKIKIHEIGSLDNFDDFYNGFKEWIYTSHGMISTLKHVPLLYHLNSKTN